MIPEKQVSFIERVSKSMLGLEGLQIVVYCDRNRFGGLSEDEIKQCTFVEIGNKLLSEVNGDYIKQKYSIENGIEFASKLHEERVRYIKKLITSR